MGNTAPQQQLQQLQIIYECEQGQVVCQKGRPQKQYFIRQLSFGNKKAMQDIAKQLQQYAAEEFGFINKLLNVQCKEESTRCGSHCKIRMFFEFSSLSLNDEIEARKSNKQYFQLNDCYRLVIGIVKALVQVQNLLQKYKNLNLNGVLNRVFCNPQRILLMERGMVQLMNPLIVSPYDRIQHRNNCYYSPEKLADFDILQDEKSVLFQLGITLINSISLKDCKQIYNGFEVQQDVINFRINQIYTIYQNQLLCQILSGITQTNKNNRFNLNQTQYYLQIMEQKLQYQQQNNIYLQRCSLAVSEKQNNFEIRDTYILRKQKNESSMKNNQLRDMDEQFISRTFEQEKQNINNTNQMKISKKHRTKSLRSNKKNNFEKTETLQSIIVTNQQQNKNFLNFTAESCTQKNSKKQSYLYGDNQVYFKSNKKVQSGKLERHRTKFNKFKTSKPQKSPLLTNPNTLLQQKIDSQTSDLNSRIMKMSISQNYGFKNPSHSDLISQEIPDNYYF